MLLGAIVFRVTSELASQPLEVYALALLLFGNREFHVQPRRPERTGAGPPARRSCRQTLQQIPPVALRRLEIVTVQPANMVLKELGRSSDRSCAAQERCIKIKEFLKQDRVIDRQRERGAMSTPGGNHSLPGEIDASARAEAARVQRREAGHPVRRRRDVSRPPEFRVAANPTRPVPSRSTGGPPASAGPGVRGESSSSTPRDDPPAAATHRGRVIRLKLHEGCRPVAGCTLPLAVRSPSRSIPN